MDVGAVFLWEQYPYNTEGEQKRRWLIYLGKFKDSPDPFDSIATVKIIAPTTTSQLHYYEPNEPRANNPYVRFSAKDSFGFISDCILDLAHSDIVIIEKVFLKHEESGQIKKMGKLSVSKLKEIYSKIFQSTGYSPKIKTQIRKNLNNAGIYGLPECRRARRRKS